MRNTIIIFLVFFVLIFCCFCGCNTFDKVKDKVVDRNSYFEIVNRAKSDIEVVYEIRIGNWFDTNSENPTEIEVGKHKIIEFFPDESEIGEIPHFTIKVYYPNSESEGEFSGDWNVFVNKYYAIETFYVTEDDDNSLRIDLY